MDNYNSSFNQLYNDSPSIRSNKSRHWSKLNEKSLLNSLNSSSNFDSDEKKQETEVEFSQILFKQFYESKCHYHDLNGIFDLLSEYESLCSDYLKVINDIKKSNLITNKLLQTLKCERNAWRLIRVLYEDRLKTESMDITLDDNLHKCISDKGIIEKLYEKDSIIRQMQLVIDWLELNEYDALEEEQYIDKIQFYSEASSLGENTLHILKTKNFNSKSYLKNSSFQNDYLDDNSLCTSMDPDAICRENKSMHSLDKEDDTRLWKYIFRFLKCGRLDLGKNLAENLGCYWLSTCLDGWVLQNDSYNENHNQDENLIEKPEGNPNRDIWKSILWQTSKMSELNDKRSLYERATFGVLSGNVNDALPLCPRWEDRLWLYFRASLDSRVELELKECIQSKQHISRTSGTICNLSRSNVDLPAEYWENLRTPSDIFKHVECDLFKNNYEIISGERYIQRIIKFIILDNIDAALEVMNEYITNNTRKDEICSTLIRFFAHFLLFCREINLINNNFRENVCNNIIETYINYLIVLKEIELIAAYVSYLPKSQQIAVYSKFLMQIKDKKQQELCLKYARDVNLDIETITKTVVENIRSSFDNNDLNEDMLNVFNIDCNLNTNLDDLDKIAALDWLFFNNIQYIELLMQSNTLMRAFILRGKVEAAKAVYLKLPIDLMDGLFKEWKKANGNEDLPNDVQNNGKEYLCYKTFFESHEAIQAWTKFFYNFKPVAPEKPNTNKFTEKVAYEHSKKNYEKELQHWVSVLDKQAQFTMQKIYDVLLFEEIGQWMKEESEYDMSDEEILRQKELRFLRRAVIPQLTFALHKVLHLSAMFSNCFELIDIIASEKYKLYKEFSNQQLRDLIKKCRESSLQVLDQSTDAFVIKNN